MAQFPDGPVEWPWCIQLVHGAHSSLRSHWCLVAFPGTRINAAPLGGAKMGEGLQLRTARSTRVPGHDHRRETINYDHRRRRLHSSPPPSLRGWLSPGQPPSPPRLPLQTQGVQDEQKTKPHEHLNPLPSGRRESRGENFQKSASGVSYPKRKSGWSKREARERDAGGGDGGGREEE